MPSLHEMQRAFARNLVELEDDAVAFHVFGDGLAPGRRIAVYRNTFEGNLVNALRLSYPAVHRLVGTEFFEGAARLFAQKQPPRTAYLDEYGAAFPEFLAHFPPAASLAYLPDVARLEWAVTRALHAPDAAPLDAPHLAKLDPADHERICFVADPSVTLVSAGSPVDAIWRAVLARDDMALGAINLAAGPVWLLVQRHATGVVVTRMEERVWRFSAALFAGQSMGAVLAHSKDTDTSTWLAEHITAGRFVGYSFSEWMTEHVAPENIS